MVNISLPKYHIDAIKSKWRFYQTDVYFTASLLGKLCNHALCEFLLQCSTINRSAFALIY